jgi:choline dehydrogenase-like flavoprotein
MADFLVVGSGATGVHAAATLLEHGHRVEMVDVGYERPDARAPDASFSELKEQLPDAERFFLGEAGESVVYPSPSAKLYGFPPSKTYVFRRTQHAGLELRGFEPMLSFARGGLAEAWSGGAYELRDEEFADFPFAGSDIRPHYDTVARRIGIGGTSDDLRRFTPLTASYLAPVAADEHSGALLERYAARRARVNAHGVYLGRSRVALLSRDLDERRACSAMGRCLWGCPRSALYTPSATLSDLRRHERFEYRPGLFVRRVSLDSRGRARGVVVSAHDASGETDMRADVVVLAAGALSSTRIYLETLAASGVAAPALPGLMDNRHVMIPFVNLSRIGSDVALSSYQFHMLAMGIDRGGWRDDAHGQITSLKAAMVHPIVSGLPFDLRSSLAMFRRVRGGLGVVNIWLADRRRDANRARLARDANGQSRLVLEYGDDGSDLPDTRSAMRTTIRALRTLGCVAPSFMAKILPRGSSVHYAGTLPMTNDDREHTLRADGGVRGIDALYVVDGAGFPWLPAKNITFTLMANAVRIAEQLA